MLEARILSEEVHRYAHPGFWSVLAALCLLLAALLLTSVWLRLGTPPAAAPQLAAAPDVAQSGAQAITRLRASLQDAQGPDAEFFGLLDITLAPIQKLSQLQQGGQAASSRDSQTLVGRTTLILEDHRILRTMAEAIEQLPSLTPTLAGAFGSTGLLSPKRLAPGSVVHGLYLASVEWAQVLAPVPPRVGVTWEQLLRAKPALQQLLNHIRSLQIEVGQPTEVVATRIRANQELLATLVAANLISRLQAFDALLMPALLARERVLLLGKDLPALPAAPVPPAKVEHWGLAELAYPWDLLQAVSVTIGLVGLSLLLALFGMRLRRRALLAVGQRWLTQIHHMEASVRLIEAPLAQVQMRIESLLQGYKKMLDRFASMQLMVSTVPSHDLAETDLWNSVGRMQQTLTEQLQLLREKLVNIELQFCSGTSAESLVYELTSVIEGLGAFQVEAQALNRSLLLSRDARQQPVGDDLLDQQLAQAQQELIGWRRTLKAAMQSLGELQHRLQTAVEDVPKGLRFEAMPDYSVSRRNLAD